MIIPLPGLLALILAAIVPLIAFAIVRPRQAIIGTYVWLWLFLPTYGIDLPGIPAFDKTTMPNFVCLLGILLFDPARIPHFFRFKWFDVPLLIWCLTPLASVHANGDPYWTGVSAVSDQMVLFGIPYFIGRVYFNNYEALRDLCIGIFIGGLVYVPLCLFEVRMSPQLHRIVYWVQTGDFVHSRRGGGWRPSVFMFAGLQLGLWMVTTAVIAMVLWRERIMRSIWGWPVEWALILVAGTAVLVKSTGALLLGAMVTVAYFVIRSNFMSRLVLLGMAGMVVMFLVLRLGADWRGAPFTTILSAVVSEQRMQSLEFRFENEAMLQDRAWQRPWLGWTGNKDPKNGNKGRNRVVNLNENSPNYGKDEAITDSMWIIAFGMYGLVGVITLYTAMLLPIVMVAWKIPPHLWRTPELSLVLMVTLVVWMSSVDKLLNAMPTPIHGLLGGGLIGFAASFAVARSPQRRPAAMPGQPTGPPPRPGPGVGRPRAAVDVR